MIGEIDKVLDVKNLSIIYKTDLETVYAVNGIDFTVNKGEALGIVGETGAGKTTTALSIMRLLPERTAKVTGGSIELCGNNLFSINEKEMQAIRGKRVSMIFQDPMTCLNPIMTVGDQIREALRLHNKNMNGKNLENRVDEILSMVGILPSRKNEYPHQFSGGMKQRVMIAMALVCEPELLIADEPTTALDVTIQAQVLKMIRDLRNKLGMSMILITHDLGVVAQVCDKVAVMYAGQIVEYGSARDIFKSKKRHPYTEGLFGSIPDMTTERDYLNPILGYAPDPTDLPKGCYFSPRCPYCTPECCEGAIEEYVDGTHKIRCLRYKKNGEEDRSTEHEE